MCIAFLFLLFTFEKGSLYSPGYHGTLYADLADLKLKFLLNSASKYKGTKGECHHIQFLPSFEFNLSCEVVLFIDSSKNKSVYI